MNRITFWAALAGILAMARMPTTCSAQVTTDLWDVSQGSVVIANSAVIDFGPAYRSSINDMFGARDANVEAGNTIFKDNRLTGFTHFVQWQTPTPIALDSFKLYATHDFPLPADANLRGFSTFNLFAKNIVTNAFELVYTNSPTNPYTFIGPGFLLIDTAVSTTVAQTFRAEFVQFGDNSSSAGGPRVLELDGFGTQVVPEPGSLALLTGLGLSSLILVRRSRRRKQ